MRANNHHCVLAIATDLDRSLALVVAYLAHPLLGQNFHHLTVMNERAVRIDRVAPSAGILTGNINRSLDTPAEACGLGTDDLHGNEREGNPKRLKRDAARSTSPNSP